MLSPRINDAPAIADEIRADEECLRDPLRLGLLRILEANPKPGAVAKKVAQHRDILRRGNDQDLAQTAEHERRERVTNHRLVVDRQQLLADDLGQRIEPGPGAAGEENRLFVHAGRVQPVSRWDHSCQKERAPVHSTFAFLVNQGPISFTDGLSRVSS